MGSMQLDIQGNRTMKRVKNLATLAQRFHKQCLRCHYMGEGLLTTNLLPLSAALQAGAKAGERVSRGVKYAIHIT